MIKINIILIYILLILNSIIPTIILNKNIKTKYDIKEIRNIILIVLLITTIFITNNYLYLIIYPIVTLLLSTKINLILKNKML